MTRGRPKDGKKKAGVAQLEEQVGRDSLTRADSTSAASPPEELSTVWDDDIAKAFQDLRPQQQDFLIAYLNTGNSAEAYRRAYNPMAKDHLASVAGSRLVASVGIEPILAKFASNKTEVMFLVIKGYREMAEAAKPNMVQDDEGQWINAGDLPDWIARDKALTGLRKVHGLDQPSEVKHSGEITSRVVQVELPKKK